MFTIFHARKDREALSQAEQCYLFGKIDRHIHLHIYFAPSKFQAPIPHNWQIYLNKMDTVL